MNRAVAIPAVFCVSAIGGCGLSADGERPLFTDITDQMGLAFVHDAGVDSSYFMPESIGAGGAFLDYDNDGDLDVYLVNGARRDRKDAVEPASRNALFRQGEDGSFSDVTEASGLGDAGYGMGVAVGDIDNDGDVDVYVTNFGPDALYRNDGDGTFTDVSLAAGIGNPVWSASAVFFDFDLDGFLDIYVTNYVALDTAVRCSDEAGRPDYCGPAAFGGVSDVLYRNRGDGSFADVSLPSGIAASASKGLGVVSADFNDDSYPDIYVANDGEANHLLINRGDGTFEDEALILGAALNALGRPEAGMGIAVGDADGDAGLDLFVTHLRGETNTFYRRAGELGFHDASAPSGLGGPSPPYTGFGCGFFDYDHDGDLDLAVVNGRVTRGPLMEGAGAGEYWGPYAEPNFLFRNDGLGGFEEVSAGAAFARPYNSRGLALGDVDNDGDIDLLVTNGGGPAQLLRNGAARGHWLLVRAIDPDLQRDAIGATVTVSVGAKRYYRLNNPGFSYLSSNDPRVHFGLASAAAVDRLEVRWPDGTTESFPGVKTDQIITLQKGEGSRVRG